MPSCSTASDKQALGEGCYSDPTYANKIRSFIESFCKQSIGEFYKRPLTLLPWQWEDFLLPVFGERRKDGSARFQQVGIFCAKSSGKSTFLSAVALQHLICGPDGAQVILVANTIDQAGIVYTSAKNMVDFMLEENPSLEGKLWARPNIKQIEWKPNKSVLKVISGNDGKSKAGAPISLCIFDEIGDFNDALLYDHLLYNTKKRRGGLMISISTAGFSTTSIGKERYDYAKAILAGEKIDTSFYALVYEASVDDDWTDIETARKCCPPGCWGVTVFPELVQQELQEAKNNPRLETAYKVLRLNQYQNSSLAWLSSVAWSACSGKLPSLEGQKAWVGLDLARRHDTACYTLLFVVDGLYFLLPRFFIPEKDAAEREQRDHFPWRRYQREGYVMMTSGDIIDYNAIRKSLNEDAKRYRIQEVGYDPWNATMIAQQLQDEDGFPVVEVKQSILSLGPATARFENLITDKKLRHGDNPILTAQAGVVVVRRDANDNIMCDKLHSRSHIDGIQSSIIALHRQMSAQEVTGDYLLIL